MPSWNLKIQHLEGRMGGGRRGTGLPNWWSEKNQQILSPEAALKLGTTVKNNYYRLLALSKFLLLILKPRFPAKTSSSWISIFCNQRGSD